MEPPHIHGKRIGKSHLLCEIWIFPSILGFPHSSHMFSHVLTRNLGAVVYVGIPQHMVISRWNIPPSPQGEGAIGADIRTGLLHRIPAPRCHGRSEKMSSG